MKKLIMIPDSFKGTLSSLNASNIMRETAESIFPNCEILSYPIADGGEGSVDCFLDDPDSKKITLRATNQFNELIETYICQNKETIILDMASAAGITLSKKLNPMVATTFGVGILINEAIKLKPKKIIIGLGGSATNDAGVGMAVALGTKFYDFEGQEFVPSATTLTRIKTIDNSVTLEKLKNIEVIAMCDVKNTLCGPNGATYTFAPQKGAKKDDLPILENNLYHLGNIIKDCMHKDVMSIQGGGAAGGMGAGVIAFLNADLRSGIDTMLDLIHFDDLLENTDYVFTGEGRFDSQSLNGKVISGIAKRCLKHNVKLIVVCGSIGDVDDSIYSLGITSVFSINTTAMEFAKAKKKVKENLKITMKNILRLLN